MAKQINKTIDLAATKKKTYEEIERIFTKDIGRKKLTAKQTITYDKVCCKNYNKINFLICYINSNNTYEKLADKRLTLATKKDKKH